jgi:linoleoyl-CoA desaturase
MYKVTFTNKSNSFHQTLKGEVEQYFLSRGIRKTGNWRLYSKSAILIPLVIAIYISLLFFHLTALVAIPLCFLMGFALSSIGFNIMHDACHGSYSRRSWVNDLMGLSLNSLGGNAFIWKMKHNIIHHTYTNVDGIDDDIAKSPLMRHCSTQKWVRAHRFQHFYMVFLYAISSIAWVFIMDFNKYFKQKIHHTDLQKMSAKEHMIFWASKLLYLLFYIAIPIVLVGWQYWLIGFLCMHIALGLTLSMVFQLAHVVEDAGFVHVEENSPQKIDEEWAIHQVKTTANFAPRNWFINWFVGGLNYQIEHHLFPRISHVHYPKIAAIVKSKCREFDIQYNEFPTMRSAVASHFRTMKELGRRP